MEILRTTPVKTVCPNFYLLAHANGCLFSPECSYCFLKSSLWHVDKPQAFANVEHLIEDVKTWIERDGLESYVLNSGNLSDSLVFETVRPIVRELVEVFRDAHRRGRPHSLLLVTKGGVDDCLPLLALTPSPNVMVSWSVNHPEAARRHEAGAAPTEDRLEAARRCKEAGWRVRMRMDPMIVGYDYLDLARQVRRLKPERVTLGMLRAEPNLLRRVGNGLFAELEPSREKGALARYPKNVRVAAYGAVIAALGPRMDVGLCEETPDVWAAAGLDPARAKCNCGL